MRLNNGKCVDGDTECVGPVCPLEDAEWTGYNDFYRCAECTTALQDAADVTATERSLR